MSPPRLRLVGRDAPEPPEQGRPMPKLACMSCGERVMAARCGEFIVVLSEHVCAAPAPADPLWQLSPRLAMERTPAIDWRFWLSCAALILATVGLDFACAGGNVQ